MSRHYSQEANQKTYSYAQLVGEAEARSKQVPQKKGGLEFMALRLDVAEKHLELAVTRKITPAEDNLLKILELGTIGARNSRKQICSKAIFRISDLSKKLGYKTQMKIWKVLKSLETKRYITREKTDDKGLEIIGLNPEVFGQVLATRQHDVERKRHLSLVPNDEITDDSSVVKSTNESSALQSERLRSQNSSFAENKRSVCDAPTKCLRNGENSVDIIKEKPLLDSSRLILDSSRWQNRDGETNVSTLEWGKEASRRRTPEEHRTIVLEQLASVKAGKSL